MKIAFKTTLVVFLVVITGCQRGFEKKEIAAKPEEKQEKANVFLTVDFEEKKPLRYKFVSRRSISIDWTAGQKQSVASSKKLTKSSEEVEMVFSYIPLEINPYGLSTIKAKCTSVSFKRSNSQSGRSKDAITYLKNKSFELKIDARGRIKDYSKLKKLAYELGEKAFRQNTSQGRVKEPDFIGDFLATQWFLWDAVSSIKNPYEGVHEGQTWRSQLSVPLPMIAKEARKVTYKLDEIRQSEDGDLAVISSSYSPAKFISGNWPLPYSGGFRMSGQFGFFRGYKVLELQGRGRQLFNIEKSRIEEDRQNYNVTFKADFPMPLGQGQKAKPRINIRQSITMELLGSQPSQKKQRKQRKKPEKSNKPEG